MEREALQAERDKNYEEALALYAKAIKVKGNFAPFVYQNRSMLYLHRAKASQDPKSKNCQSRTRHSRLQDFHQTGRDREGSIKPRIRKGRYTS